MSKNAPSAEVHRSRFANAAQLDIIVLAVPSGTSSSGRVGISDSGLGEGGNRLPAPRHLRRKGRF